MKPDLDGKSVEPAGNAASVDSMLAYCQAQDVLFAETLSRLNLQALELPSRRTGRLRANVWRNHNFETFEGLLRPFLIYAGLDLECRVSEYDDTLGFAQWA